MATLTQPTLNQLLNEVRIFLNQENPDNSQWSDKELTNYINDGIRVYFQKINEYAEGQFDIKTSLDVVSGTETVALPTDCFEIKVLYSVQNSTRVPLEYRNNINESYSTEGTSSSSLYEPSYYLRSNNIVLRPIPQFTETGALELEYTAFPETLIWGGDVVSSGISPVFKEILVTYAVYKAKLRESASLGTNTYSAVQQHLADLTVVFDRTVTLRSKYPQFIKPWIPQ